MDENVCRTRSPLPRDPNKQIEIYTRPEQKAIFISSVYCGRVRSGYNVFRFNRRQAFSLTSMFYDEKQTRLVYELKV